MKSWLSRVMVFLMLFLVYSRGLFEIAVSKKAGYLISVVAIFAFFIYLFRKSGIRQPQSRALWVFPGLCLLTAVVSCCLTYFHLHFLEGPVIYCVVMAVIFLFLFMGETLSLDDPKYLLRPLIGVGLILTLTAVFQQLYGQALTSDQYLALSDQFGPFFNRGGIHFTTHGFWIRPTSLTGSYLHFPIIIPLLGALVLALSDRLWEKGTGLLMVIYPFITLSRSGMLISSVILFWVLLRLAVMTISYCHENRKVPQMVAGLVIGLFLAVLLFIKVGALNQAAGQVYQRIFHFRDVGNQSRRQFWVNAMDHVKGTTVVFGSYTGYFSNIVPNLASGMVSRKSDIKRYTVTESSVLQLLLNLGVMGILVFYGLMTVQTLRIFWSSEHKILGFAYAGAILETFFYQSIEVMPFMFTLFLMVIISRQKAARGTQGKEADAKKS